MEGPGKARPIVGLLQGFGQVFIVAVKIILGADVCAYGEANYELEAVIQFRFQNIFHGFYIIRSQGIRCTVHVLQAKPAQHHLCLHNTLPIAWLLVPEYGADS